MSKESLFNNSLDRLVMALDVPTIDEAKTIVTLLGDSVTFYKVGLELFMSGQAFPLIDWLKAQDKKVFLDVKLFDIPATVGRAIKQVDKLGVDVVTIHGNDEMMKYAADAAENVGILAVTVLTSMDKGDMKDLGFECDIQSLVVSRAKRAYEHGCLGVIASAQEAQSIRNVVSKDFTIMTPGIRPMIGNEQSASNEQKRIMTVEQAFASGASHIVVGRPIRDAEDPVMVANLVQQQIKDSL